MSEDFVALSELVAKARENLSTPEWESIVGGAETETTIWRNRAAIAALAFEPRIMRDVSVIDTSATLLGSKLRIPYLLAPVGGLQAFAANGAATAALAASAYGTLQVVSSVSDPDLETTAAAAAGDKWFQLYIRGDFDWIEAMLERVRSAGYKALVITGDSAYYGNRERQVVRRWLPVGRKGNDGGADFQKAVDWALLDRIRDAAGLPLVLKGVQTAADAKLAVDHGVAAVWISNHGGRQLDHVRASVDVLPDAVAAVAGRVPVIVDGGFMRGNDILKAIALGATAVAGGRLYALSLAAAADTGVRRMLELLESELINAMGLIGVATLGELDPAYVSRAVMPHMTRAFPLLGDVL